jgi:lipoyl(octanoyl) transferase
MPDIEWRIDAGLTEYPAALAIMEARVGAIIAGTASELIWLVEHPPLYTAGTSAKPSDLIDPSRFPVFNAGRGGQYTYHGPGQRVVYVMINLGERGHDVRKYVQALENWIIAVLSDCGIAAHIVPGRVGVWVGDAGREAKIAAIGVRLRRWISFHGFAINVEPELSHFQGIVPCGISDSAVTSIADLGYTQRFDAVDSSLVRHFADFLSHLNR